VITTNEGSTVLLSDEEGSHGLEALLAARTGPAAWYSSVAEMVQRQPLSSIAVLVLLFHAAPKGILLVTIGRMSLEYPAMQKVAVLDGPLPLPIVEYLTACGVRLMWDGATEDGTDRLASVVNRLHERTRWIAS
jgi:hypothetical protein